MNRQRKAAILLRAVLLSLSFTGCLLAPVGDNSPDGLHAQTPPQGQVLGSLTEAERAWLRDHPVITLGHDPGWPPIEFSNERGELSGMSGDYLRLVEERLGVKFEQAKNLTWQEVYARQKRGEIDVATCVAQTPQRTEFWAFTKPYLRIPIVIATQTEVTYIGEMKELLHKRVAVVEGYAIDDWITKDFPGIDLVRVRDPQEGLNLLQRGDVFAYLDNLLIIGDYQAKGKVTHIKIAGQTPYENAQCMAVRKDWAVLAGILDKALESISEAERQDIYRKWLPVRYEHGFDYTLFWQALAVFAVVLLVLVVWNRRLTREVRKRQQAEAALQQQAGELAALHALGRAVNATLSVAEATKAALQGMLNAIHPDLAFLFLRDGERLILKDALPAVARSRLGDFPEHRVGECICGLAVREGRPLYSRDICRDARCGWQECKRAGIRSFAALPLRSGDDITGVIGLASDTERDFERQAGFLETLTGQVAVALDNARLFEVAQRELADRRRAEKALKASKMRQSAILNNIPDIAWLKDSESRFTATNEAFARAAGWTTGDLVGKTDFDIWPRDLAESYRMGDADVMRSRKPKRIEERLVDRAGNQTWIETIKNPILDDAGEVIGTTGIARDITERKRAEEALRESRNLLQTVLDTIPARVFWKDRHSNFLGCNQPFALDAGVRSPSEMVGKDDYRMGWREQADLYRSDDRQVMESGNPKFNYEEPQTTPEGRTIWLRTSKVPLRNRDGAVFGVLGTYEDITEIKRAEGALRSSLEEKESLLKEVHHRVKNNLQVISSLLSLQFRKVKNAEDRSFLRDTQNRIRSMAMLHEILYRSGNIAHVSFPLYVKRLCDHVAGSYGSAAKRIRFKHHVADVALNLDQAITAGLIINELVTNAIKHAFPSRSGGDILVELQAADDHRLVLRVSDNGVGFPPEANVQSDDRLGLLLVRTLSQNLGGQLSAKSESGAVFEVVFQPNTLEM